MRLSFISLGHLQSGRKRFLLCDTVLVASYITLNIKTGGFHAFHYVRIMSTQTLINYCYSLIIFYGCSESKLSKPRLISRSHLYLNLELN